jgi:hypothetical protein
VPGTVTQTVPGTVPGTVPQTGPETGPKTGPETGPGTGPGTVRGTVPWTGAPQEPTISPQAGYLCAEVIETIADCRNQLIALYLTPHI